METGNNAGEIEGFSDDDGDGVGIVAGNVIGGTDGGSEMEGVTVGGIEGDADTDGVADFDGDADGQVENVGDGVLYIWLKFLAQVAKSRCGNSVQFMLPCKLFTQIGRAHV